MSWITRVGALQERASLVMREAELASGLRLHR